MHSRPENPSSINDFWPFMKFQKMEFGQKIFFVKLIYLISRVCLAWTFLNFLAHCVAVTYSRVPSKGQS